jgi:hypothetical protein
MTQNQWAPRVKRAEVSCAASFNIKTLAEFSISTVQYSGSMVKILKKKTVVFNTVDI